MNYQLVKNTEWKEKEVNEEDKKIPMTWNVDTIGKVFKINGGGTPSTTNKEFWNGDIPWLGPKEMSKEKSAYIGIGEKNISELGAKKLGNKKILKNSIIISTRAPVGYLKFAKNDLYTNQGCHSLLPSQMVDNQYMYYWLTKNKYILEKKSNGTTFKELSHGNLKSIEFVFPELNNQKSIASILSKQENIISNIEKLIEKNEIIFNELSEQLLSGELRLQDNNGKISLYKNPEGNWKEVEVNGEIKKIPNDWNKKIVKEFILEMCEGGTPPTSDESFYESADIPWVIVEDIKDNIFKTKKYINKKGLKKIGNKLWDVGDIIMSTGATIGVVGKVGIPLATKQGVSGFKVKKEEMVSDFLFYLFKNHKELFLKTANGSTFKSLPQKDIKTLEFVYPNKTEQSLIIKLLDRTNESILRYKSLLTKEKEKFEWLLDNLLSGNYLVKEIEK